MRMIKATAILLGLIALTLIATGLAIWNRDLHGKYTFVEYDCAVAYLGNDGQIYEIALHRDDERCPDIWLDVRETGAIRLSEVDREAASRITGKPIDSGRVGDALQFFTIRDTHFRFEGGRLSSIRFNKGVKIGKSPETMGLLPITQAEAVDLFGPARDRGSVRVQAP